jgi:hypothetical protein
MKTVILTSLLGLAAIANASTIIGNTDLISGVLDAEHNGMHVTIDGSFSYASTPNPTVSFSDLTSFSLKVGESFAYGWGVPGVSNVTSYYNLGLSDIKSFSFDPTTDLLSADLQLYPSNPDIEASYSMLSFFPNPDPVIMFPQYGPEMGVTGGNAFGTIDPSPVAVAAEPEGLGLLGLSGIGFGAWRKKKKAPVAGL